MRIRVLKHIAKIPTQDTGSYEVAFPDGRPSVFFYWDDLARTEQDKLPKK
jgi:hypothetical protein